MRYYKNEDHLIQYNPETGVYRKRNSITHKNILTKEEFDKLEDIKEIKKQKFCELMNIYFKSIKHRWEYNGVKYRKIDNFESNEYDMCSNYNWKDIPRHVIKNKEYLGKLMLVYHWGRVYYFTFSYNGYPQGQLIDTVNFELVRWARPKHCSPIFNEITKKIV